MSLSRLILLVFSLLWSEAQYAPAADPLVRFATLTAGDEVQLKHVEFGLPGSCHAYEYSFRFSSNVSVSVTELVGRKPVSLSDTNSAGEYSGFTNQVPIGEFTLSDSNLRGLDLLMDFYRQKQPVIGSDCVDAIVVTQRRNGQVVAVEKLLGNCYTRGIKGVTELTWIRHRAETLRKKKAH